MRCSNTESANLKKPNNLIAHQQGDSPLLRTPLLHLLHIEKHRRQITLKRYDPFFELHECVM